jgi:hypothetical protein
MENLISIISKKIKLYNVPSSIDLNIDDPIAAYELYLSLQVIPPIDVIVENKEAKLHGDFLAEIKQNITRFNISLDNLSSLIRRNPAAAKLYYIVFDHLLSIGQHPYHQMMNRIISDISTLKDYPYNNNGYLLCMRHGFAPVSKWFLYNELCNELKLSNGLDISSWSSKLNIGLILIKRQTPNAVFIDGKKLLTSTSTSQHPNRGISSEVFNSTNVLSRDKNKSKYDYKIEVIDNRERNYVLETVNTKWRFLSPYQTSNYLYGIAQHLTNRFVEDNINKSINVYNQTAMNIITANMFQKVPSELETKIPIEAKIEIGEIRSAIYQRIIKHRKLLKSPADIVIIIENEIVDNYSNKKNLNTSVDKNTKSSAQDKSVDNMLIEVLLSSIADITLLAESIAQDIFSILSEEDEGKFELKLFAALESINNESPLISSGNAKLALLTEV